MSINKEREFKIYRNEEYAYKNTSCIKSFQLKKDKILKCLNALEEFAAISDQKNSRKILKSFFR